MWNQDLPHYDSTCFEDLGYHVAYSEFPFDAHECGSYTAWRPDYRPWVGTDEMIALSVPGMVFFALTGEYGDFSGCDRWHKSKGKWFRQVLPVGSQIDLLLKQIPRYCKQYACKPRQISNITLASTGFHFTDESGEGDFARPVGFTPAFQHNVGLDDTIIPPRWILTAEKAVRSRQVPDCDPPTAVLLNPWSPDPPSSPHLDDEPRIHATLAGKGFRHFFQLGTQHTYLRAEEATLGVSFNAQSQAPDIPDIPSRAERVEYSWSLNATALAIPSPSLRASKQELVVSLNAQAQAPDIPGFSIRAAIAQYTASLQAQTKAPDIPSRSAKAPDIPSRSLRASKHELSASLNAQAEAPDDPCPLHPHVAPREYGLTSSVSNQVLPRFASMRHSHPSFPYASHDHAHLLTCRSLEQSYTGNVRLEVFVRRLLIRIVSQGVACVFSVGLGGCLLDRMCFFTYPCDYTLYIFLYLSFA